MMTDPFLDKPIPFPDKSIVESKTMRLTGYIVIGIAGILMLGYLIATFITNCC
jgi:hypothetical protein